MIKNLTITLLTIIAALTATAETIDISPGTLRKKLTPELRRATELKLTGDINADDIFTLRDEFTALQTLDLSEARIVASQSNRMPSGIRRERAADELPEGALFGSQLTMLQLPAGLKTIGDAALAATGIKQLTVPEGVTSIGHMAFYGSAIESITLPSTLTTVGDYAFGRSGLTKLDLSQTKVTVIPKGMAFYADKLKTANFPTSTSEIGDYALCGTAAITEFHIPLNTVRIGDCAMLGCGSAVVRVPKATVSVGDYAFAYMPNLKEGNFYDKPESLGEGLFAGCPKLESIGMASVTVMPGLFMSDSPNATVNLGTIEEMGRYAMLNNGAESIKLGKNTHTLGDCALEGMTALRTIDAAERGANVTQTGTDTFKGVDTATTVVVQAGTEAAWREHPEWGRFKIYAPAGIDDAEAGFALKAHFNGDMLLIEASEPISRADIYNVAGQCLVTSDPDAVTASIDTAALTDMIYIVRVSCAGKTQTFKLIR